MSNDDDDDDEEQVKKHKKKHKKHKKNKKQSPKRFNKIYFSLDLLIDIIDLFKLVRKMKSRPIKMMV